ncbi:MAG: phosphatidate cytidylyltransferase [Clostridia bacterium]
MLAARVLTAAVLIAGLLAALFLLPAAWLAGLVALIVGLAAHEWAGLCKLPRGAGLAYAVLAGACVAALSWTGSAKAALVVGAAFWIAVAPLWLWRGVRPSHAPLLAAGGLAVLVPAGVAMTVLSPLQVLLSLGLTWVADTAAYFVGRRFGRHKLAPTISPGKTWEGAAGALAGTAAYAIICAGFVPQLKAGISGGAWGIYAAAILVLCAASIGGDLFESAAKRQASVKDSGTLLPGHGGLLDRIDSATAVLPLCAVLWPLTTLQP